MELMTQYSFFLLKTITLVIAFLIILVCIFSLGRRSKSNIQIDSLNNAYAAQKKQLQKSIPQDKVNQKKQAKKIKKLAKSTKESVLPSRFVLSFEGDMHASQVTQLRDEISMILSLANSKDEVVLRIESPGGEVSGYGLAASQLMRLRDKNIPLTVCIDKVAASGGYLMACVANKILAAPFAVIGSIGVVAQLPNFHRLLKKNNIDVEQLTAGKYKRTLSVFGENTKEGREKFKEDLEAIHRLFQKHVLTHRNQVDIDRISTGEHWLAKDAIALGLIDELKTSDDYLYDEIDQYNTLVLSTPVKQTLIDKIIKPLYTFLYSQHLR